MFIDKYSIGITKDVFITDDGKNGEYLIEFGITNYEHSKLFHILDLIKKKYPKKDVLFLSNNRNLNECIWIEPYINGVQIDERKYKAIFTSEKVNKTPNIVTNPTFVVFSLIDIIGTLHRYPNYAESLGIVTKLKELNEELLDPYLKGLYHQIHRLDYHKCDCGCNKHNLEIMTMIVTEITFVPYIKEILFSEKRNSRARVLVENITTSIN